MKKEITALLERICNVPESIEFNDVIDTIDKCYRYTPTQFSNGLDSDNDICLINKPGENEGSCKIFSFAKIHNLNEDETLHCFGAYYRDDVLKYPDNEDHQNIRNFMKSGWAHIYFEKDALVEIE